MTEAVQADEEEDEELNKLKIPPGPWQGARARKADLAPGAEGPSHVGEQLVEAANGLRSHHIAYAHHVHEVRDREPAPLCHLPTSTPSQPRHLLNELCKTWCRSGTCRVRERRLIAGGERVRRVAGAASADREAAAAAGAAGGARQSARGRAGGAGRRQGARREPGGASEAHARRAPKPVRAAAAAGRAAAREAASAQPRRALLLYGAHHAAGRCVCPEKPQDYGSSSSMDPSTHDTQTST